MTKEDRIILDRINDYANEVLQGIDPQKVQISIQLDKLRPIMETIAKEENCTLEEIFIKYMDLASLQGVEEERKFQATINNPKDFVDFNLNAPK